MAQCLLCKPHGLSSIPGTRVKVGREPTPQTRLLTLTRHSVHISMPHN